MKNVTIEKRNADMNVVYKDGVESQQNVTRANYAVMADGKEVGSVDIYKGSVNLNLHTTGRKTVAENEELVRQMFEQVAIDTANPAEGE